MVHTKRQLVNDATSSDSWIRCLAEEALHNKSNLTRPRPTIQIALGFSMTVFLFCLHGLKVLCPKVFQGKGRYALLIFGIMIVAHLLFLRIDASRIDKSDAMCLRTFEGYSQLQILPDYTQVMIATTTRLYMWMIPLVLPLVSTGSRRSRFFWCACTIILEVTFFIRDETPKLSTINFYS